MDRTAPPQALREGLQHAQEQAGGVPTDAARNLAASRTAAQRLALERKIGDAWRPGFSRPPPGIDQPDVGGQSFGRGAAKARRPQSVPPEWLERAGPNETAMSVRMANRARFLAEAQKKHSRKAGYITTDSHSGASPAGGRWGPGERGRWMEHLIEDTFSSEDFQNSVSVAQLAAMTDKGSGVTFGPDGKFHRVHHYAPGHIGHERARRGLPSRYGGFVPEHIRHDCVGAGAAYKIGSKEHARALHAASGMNQQMRQGAARPEMHAQMQRPSTVHQQRPSASAGDASVSSDQNYTPRHFMSRILTPRAPRGSRGGRPAIHV